MLLVDWNFVYILGHTWLPCWVSEVSESESESQWCVSCHVIQVDRLLAANIGWHRILVDCWCIWILLIIAWLKWQQSPSLFPLPTGNFKEESITYVHMLIIDGGSIVSAMGWYLLTEWITGGVSLDIHVSVGMSVDTWPTPSPLPWDQQAVAYWLKVGGICIHCLAETAAMS